MTLAKILTTIASVRELWMIGRIGFAKRTDDLTICIEGSMFLDGVSSIIWFLGILLKGWSSYVFSWILLPPTWKFEMRNPEPLKNTMQINSIAGSLGWLKRLFEVLQLDSFSLCSYKNQHKSANSYYLLSISSRPIYQPTRHESWFKLAPYYKITA